MVTETWLKNTYQDQTWVQWSEINRNNLTIQTHNRTNKWGGGLALIHNKEYKVDISNREDTDMYESCTWKLPIWTSTLSILGVYHPSNTNNYKFIDDLTDKIMEELSQDKNKVIAGDLNIHWDNLDSKETLLLRDTIDAIGWKQHVSKFTDNANLIIDLLIIESIRLIKVMQCKAAELYFHIRPLTSSHGCQHKQTKKCNQQNQNKTNCFHNSEGILKAFQHQQNTCITITVMYYRFIEHHCYTCSWSNSTTQGSNINQKQYPTLVQ